MWKTVFFTILVFLEVRAQSFRLPNNTRPEAYHTTLTFSDFENETELDFLGESLIKIHILERTFHITIHSAVNITEAPYLCQTMTTACTNPVNLTTFYVRDRELLHLYSKDWLEESEIYYLYIQYTGRIYSAINGVYRGNYFTEIGVQK